MLQKITPPRISLAAARVNACLNQRDAACAIGVDRKTLQSYEKGTTTPNWEIVQRIETVYSYPAELIFFGSKTRLKRDSGGNAS